ncbi:MAG: hypothetical protein U9Q82_01305, partial [Chloroflexota bacterium]|nr:hypothetical protein [Chloroflexota bacterium]
MTNTSPTPTTPKRLKYAPILLLIAINLIIGVFVLHDYGNSWDEFKFYKYANLTLGSLEKWWSEGVFPTFGNTYDNYGPAYVVGITLVTRTLGKLGIDWAVPQIRHFIYFATFQLGVYYFYCLCLRWLHDWAAFGATLLFSTQPLFWGHAFISPKDIPFMSFFLASVALGLRAHDSVLGEGHVPRIFDAVAANWRQLSKNSKRNLLVATLLWLTALSLLVCGTQVFYNLISNVMSGLYQSNQQTLLGRLFAFVAEDAYQASANIYIGKAFTLFQQLRFLLLIISPAPIIWYFWKKFRPIFTLINAPIILAGFALGLTTSIRILGPLAGLLVGLYMLVKSGKRAIPVLFFYTLIALYVVYVSWPYLWPNPLEHVYESLTVMSRYPWRGETLFNYNYYSSADIPWTYLPVVLAIQFTEPVLVLFLIGLIGLVWVWIKTKNRQNLLILVSIWFFIPVIGLVVSRAPLYDNSRQVFFLLPPIFLVAGIALDMIFETIHRPMLKAIIMAALILPGIFQGVKLHPYQYIYYNSIIGGVKGAYRRFELDYWGLSYPEAA